MTPDNFKNLLSSIREAGQILRGEQQAFREFVVEVPPKRFQTQTSYAICVQTDDPALLIPHKVYTIRFSQSGLVNVVDEAGETALYPEDFFLAVAFPKEVEQLLAQPLQLALK
jgi:hypothetical protein